MARWSETRGGGEALRREGRENCSVRYQTADLARWFEDEGWPNWGGGLPSGEAWEGVCGEGKGLGGDQDKAAWPWRRKADASLWSKEEGVGACVCAR